MKLNWVSPGVIACKVVANLKVKKFLGISIATLLDFTNAIYIR